MSDSVSSTASTSANTYRSSSTASSNAFPDQVWQIAMDRWLNTYIRNSAVSGATEAWNHLHTVLPEFKKIFQEEASKL